MKPIQSNRTNRHWDIWPSSFRRFPDEKFSRSCQPALDGSEGDQKPASLHQPRVDGDKEPKGDFEV